MNETEKATFTPGPWRAEGQYVMGPGDQLLAVAGRSTEPAIHIAHEANARLIAAAPDLLHALEQLQVTSERMDGVAMSYWQHVLALTDAAIRKACGEQS